MTDTALLLSRLGLAAKIAAKITLTENLRDRVIQKCSALMALALEGENELRKATVSAVLDRNTKRLETFVKGADRTSRHLDKVAKRLTDIDDFVDQPAGRVDRIMSRSLSSLERIQSLLELELLELDGISDEIEEAIGKKDRSKGN
jgi:hypothetical protein